MNKKKKKTLKCYYQGCERQSFSSKWVLKRHLERLHSDEYQCDKCDKIFNNATSLTKHKKNVHRGFVCHICFTRFSSEIYLNRHHKNFHTAVQAAEQICTQCDLQFRTRGQFNLHMVQNHTNETSFKLMNQAFRNKHQDWRKILATDMAPESLFYSHYYEEIVTFLKNQQSRIKTFAYNLCLVCIYESPIAGEINDTFRQGKFKTFIYSTYLEKNDKFLLHF